MMVEAGTVATSDETAIAGIIRTALIDGDVERWCNLTFAVDEDDPHSTPDSPLFGLLAARGPSNPLATVMGATSGRKSQPAQVGLQHRAGQKVAAQLISSGIGIPDGWRSLQDHPRRGLIIALPDGDCSVEVVRWLLPAMHHLNRAPVLDSLVYQCFAIGSW